MGFLDRFKKGGATAAKTSDHAEGRKRLERFELDDAVELLTRAREADPESLPVALDLGRALLESSRLELADALVADVLEMAPEDPRSHLLAASLYKETSRYDDAVKEIEAAFELAPSSAEAWLLQTQLMNVQERPEEAREAGDTVLRLDRKNAAAHREMAYASLLLRDVGSAQRHAAKAADLAYDDPRTRVLQSVLALFEGNLERALDDVEEALEINPWLVEAWNHKGYVLRVSGLLEEAEEALQKGLELNPFRVNVHYYFGILYAQMNRMEEARASLLRTLEIKPHHGTAHWNYAKITKYAPGDEHLELMRRLEQDQQTPRQTLLQLHFALAKACEDLGEYDAAFEHLRQGNELKLEITNYDFAADKQVVQSAQETFSAETLEQAGQAPLPELAPEEEELLEESELMVFIVGMPRCGSTLVEQILDSHPAIVGAGEAAILDRALAHAQSSLPPMPGESTAAHLKRLVVKAAPMYVASMTGIAFRDMDEEQVSGVERITDKTLNNFLNIGAIRLAMPRARIVHCRRNPVDTCLSCYKNLFEMGLGYTYDLRTLGRYYRLYHELMEHWESVLPGAMLHLDYEALVAEPEARVRELLAWLEVDFHPDCLAFHENRRQVQTASLAQVRQPIYKDSVALWRHYEKHLGPLLEELGPLAG